jgi:regulatory protein
VRIIALEEGANGAVKIGLADGSFFLFRIAYLFGPTEGDGETPETPFCAPFATELNFLWFLDRHLREGDDFEPPPGLLECFTRASRLYLVEKQALAYLARREHSAAELREKLAKKDFEAADVGAVLGELAKRGWQSDRRFTEYFISARLRAHAEGSVAIRAKLRQKGITKELIEEYLQERNGDIQVGLTKVYQKLYISEKKRLKKKLGETELKEKDLVSSVIKKLMQRGYPYPEIKRLINEAKASDIIELDDCT